jgi:hypothetical protein
MKWDYKKKSDRRNCRASEEDEARKWLCKETSLASHVTVVTDARAGKGELLKEMFYPMSMQRLYQKILLEIVETDCRNDCPGEGQQGFNRTRVRATNHHGKFQPENGTNIC